MPREHSAECLEFQGLFSKPLIAQFDEPNGSSDGGAVLLKAADEKLGLIDKLASCIKDARQTGKVAHDVREMLAQRVFGIVCGYDDCNDAARLARDPVHKLLAGLSAADESLASQPTLSRFENSVGWKELYRMGMKLSETVINRHALRLRKRARLITIDMDPTVDPTHGQQEFTFFSAFYDTWCYLPQICTLTFNNEKEQYLCAAVLRRGNASAKLAAVGILKRAIAQLRAAFQRTRIRVRLDGAFAAPEVFDYLESENVGYVVNMAKNSVLKAKAKKLMNKARRLSKASGRTEHVYGECMYAAGKWGCKRRVIIKAEVVCHPGREPKDNPRFVVTNLKQSPEYVYRKVYCKRGDAENRIKELKESLALDRTSCTSFKANQLRVMFSTAGYILMQEIRLAARRTAAARFQVSTIQTHLLKLGVRVIESTRRIVLHLPQTFPHIDAFRQIALSLGANSA